MGMSFSGVTGAGRGRGSLKGQAKNDFPLMQNGVGKKVLEDIEILRTDTLIKDVDKVFGASHPDSIEIEKAKKALKEHEQALVDAIARLEGASDGESGFKHMESILSHKGSQRIKKERGEIGRTMMRWVKVECLRGPMAR
ncbi:protein EMSY-LIKE 3-like [Hibiscus syriacus]|uniref:protein EMSY-LIKE 3-like n=1 Tax=Hibiscus syriacus TaxID=106335 RepID=UPI00192056F0|nr:protein EMSY-LIKE 3-like [Hibiscus syriacus]